MKPTALITGASNGIGLEMAKLHAKTGGDVVLVARSRDKLEALAQEIETAHGVRAWVIAQDLAQPNAAQAIFDATQSMGVDIDYLINNAGFGGHGCFFERELIKEQQMIQVNITTLTELCHLYLPSMVARRRGKILNVSSTASFMPGPLQAVYYATKAYVTSFSQAIAEEVAEFGITVTALCPGAVATGFVVAGGLEDVDAWKNAKTPLEVAEYGYNAMMDGELVAFNEAKLKFALEYVIPLLPRKTVLKMSCKVMKNRNNTAQKTTMILVKLCYLEQSVLHLSNGNIMHALIIGATGATGSSLLTQLLADEKFSQVSIFVRKPVAVKHDKLIVHVIDFDKIDDYRDKITGDVLFSCLGTTLKDAGSQDAQWKIDYTYQYEFAKLAKHGGIKHLVLVSSAFADAKARGFYVRMKGQLEQDVMALGFERLSIFRPPSLIRPNTDRLGEKISLPIIKALNSVGLIKNMRPMAVETLATALITAAKHPPKDVQILEAKDIWQMVKSN